MNGNLSIHESRRDKNDFNIIYFVILSSLGVFLISTLMSH